MVDKILEQKTVRITPMRQLLLAFFLEKNKILGLRELEKAFPKSDRITIYRTLKTFEEKGIVHAITNGTSEVKYALCKDCKVASHSDTHPHFYCKRCEEIECLESVIIPLLDLPSGYFFEKMEMTIQGICANCSGLKK